MSRAHPCVRQRLVWRRSHGRGVRRAGASGRGNGVSRFKFDPFGSAWKVLTKADAEAVVATVAAVRDAVGPDIGLMIEFHGRLAVGTAIAMVHALERFDPVWCEEPVTPDSLDLLAEVKRSVRFPIAAGERLYTQADFYRLTAPRAADVVQMDVAHCGGILASKKIAAMADGRTCALRPLLDRAGRLGRLPAPRPVHAKLHDSRSVRRVRCPLAQ